jgi:phospholipid/cholesterol/gamma-HCH transport system substrate-binding protein
MAFTPAAKVGLATVASVAVIAAGLGWLMSLSLGSSGYDFDVHYKDVSGLMPGAGVMLMGVRVGKVLTVVPEDQMVRVHVHIFDPKIKIMKNGRFKIMSPGIVGEKNLEIFPPKEKATPTAGGIGTEGDTPGAPTPLPTSTPAPTFLVNGDNVRGDDPARMELVMDELTDTFNEFKKTTDPKKFQDLFAKTAENLMETTETVKRLGTKAEGILGGFGGTPQNLNQMLTSIDRAARKADAVMTSANPRDIRATVANLNALSAGLMTSYKNFFGNEQQQANDTTLQTVRSLASQLNKLATTLNTTAGDPVVQNDVKDTIKNIRSLTQSLSGATAITNQPNKVLQGLAFSPRLQGVAANTPSGTGLAGNLGMRVNFGTNYVQGGLEQIGEGNYLDLAFGSPDGWKGLGYEFGLIRSKIGVGVDYGLTDGIRLSGELYDPFRPTVRIGATYFPLAGSQYGLLAQWAREIQSSDNYIWLGVEWRPNY